MFAPQSHDEDMKLGSSADVVELGAHLCRKNIKQRGDESS
jgi:hypothetical protein